MKNELSKIGEQSKKYKKVQSLMHYVSRDTLMESFRKIDPKKAVGIDEVNKDDCSEHLEDNIDDLLAKMKRMGWDIIPSQRKPGTYLRITVRCED